MNFSIEHEPAPVGPIIRNRAPRPGELSVYQGSSVSGVAGGYSIVAFLPNLNRDGNVLIIAGTTMNATEAAGEFITNPARSAAFLVLLRPDPDRRHSLLRSPSQYQEHGRCRQGIVPRHVPPHRFP